MNFKPVPLADAWLIESVVNADERGSFARRWCAREFAEHGIAHAFVQSSVSRTRQAGTLRGLHFQWPPSMEAKLVSCETGSIHDVIVDLRPDSATFGEHFAVQLDAQSTQSLYVPPGFAHGFQTLEDDCTVSYTMTDFYQPELADGVRFDDEHFGICWPRQVTQIVERDRSYPDFDPQVYRDRYSRQLAERGSDS